MNFDKTSIRKSRMSGIFSGFIQLKPFEKLLFLGELRKKFMRVKSPRNFYNQKKFESNFVTAF